MFIDVVAGSAPSEVAFCSVKATVFVAAHPDGAVMDWAARVKCVFAAFALVGAVDDCADVDDAAIPMLFETGIDDEPPGEQATSMLKSNDNVRARDVCIHFLQYAEQMSTQVRGQLSAAFA